MAQIDVVDRGVGLTAGRGASARSSRSGARIGGAQRHARRRVGLALVKEYLRVMGGDVVRPRRSPAWVRCSPSPLPLDVAAATRCVPSAWAQWRHDLQPRRDRRRRGRTGGHRRGAQGAVRPPRIASGSTVTTTTTTWAAAATCAPARCCPTACWRSCAATTRSSSARSEHRRCRPACSNGACCCGCGSPSTSTSTCGRSSCIPGVPSPVAGLTPERCDLVVVRENTEGLYAGAGGVAVPRHRRRRSRRRSR